MKRFIALILIGGFSVCACPAFAQYGLAYKDGLETWSVLIFSVLWVVYCFGKYGKRGASQPKEWKPDQPKEWETFLFFAAIGCAIVSAAMIFKSWIMP